MPALQTVEVGLAQVYCERCHLATPIWRKKCIHCSMPLSDNPIQEAVTQNGGTRGHAENYRNRSSGR